MVIAFTYAKLVVGMAQVNGSKDSSLAQMVKQVCNSWNQECIKLCLTIQTMVIDAHPNFACFLLYKENWSTIG